MDNYVTGAVIRRLRERKGLTQEELADKIFVSGKAVSKWERGQGFPDVSLLEPLARALDLSVIELLSGADVLNRNPAANMARGRFYVCPVCGNVIQSIGEAVISCCGITLPPLEPEDADAAHVIRAEIVEDEYYVSLAHPMTREHHHLSGGCVGSWRPVCQALSGGKRGGALQDRPCTDAVRLLQPARAVPGKAGRSAGTPRRWTHARIKSVGKRRKNVACAAGVLYTLDRRPAPQNLKRGGVRGLQ